MAYSLDRETAFVVVWFVLMTIACSAVFFGLSPTRGVYEASIYTLVVFIAMVFVGIFIYKTVIED